MNTHYIQKMFVFVTEPIVERILSFQNLKAGWMYGEGNPISSNVIEKALKTHSLLKSYGAEEVEAFPIEDGRLMLAGYHSTKTVEVWCNHLGNFEIKIEENDEVIDKLSINSFIELENLLRSFSWNKIPTADLHIHNITALKSNDMVAQLSENKATGHPSSAKNVQLTNQNQPAYTYKSATKFALQDHQ